MSVDIRLPNITADTQSGKMAQMQSYMYQLVEQLNWALNTISSADGTNSQNIVYVGDNKPISSEDAVDTFNSIKSLIIKSADIVNAYYDTIHSRLDGVYVAESEYGTFKEETRQDILENSTGITQLFTDKQTIESRVGSIESSILDTSAWIKTGLLGYDSSSIPIYGIEVGQKTTEGGVEVFNKYARFTSGGIYFYLPGIADAVAWMTGTKLYITNAEITGSLKLGGYVCDMSNGMAFKWVGR